MAELVFHVTFEWIPACDRLSLKSWMGNPELSPLGIGVLAMEMYQCGWMFGWLPIMFKAIDWQFHFASGAASELLRKFSPGG